MEERLSREEILQLLAVEHDRLNATLSRLKPNQMVKPGVVGHWSVKDVMAHLIFWNGFPLQEIEAAVRGETFEHPQGTTDEINARTVAHYSEHSLSEVLSNFETGYAALCRLVQNLPDEAFALDNPIEQALDETIHGALANNTYEHWPIHERQIREWMERNGTD